MEIYNENLKLNNTKQQISIFNEYLIYTNNKYLLKKENNLEIQKIALELKNSNIKFDNFDFRDPQNCIKVLQVFFWLKPSWIFWRDLFSKIIEFQWNNMFYKNNSLYKTKWRKDWIIWLNTLNSIYRQLLINNSSSCKTIIDNSVIKKNKIELLLK